MKLLLSFNLVALVLFCAGCQPAGVAPVTAKATPVAIWVTVDSPDGSRSPQDLFQIAELAVVPALKKTSAASNVQLLGSDKHLAIADDVPAALIKVTLQPGENSASDFHQAFRKMESLPAAVNIALDETTDGIFTVELLLPDGSSFEQTHKTAVQAAELVQDLPDVGSTVTYFDPEKANLATMLVQQKEGKPAYSEVALMLDKSLPGAKCFVTGKPSAK